jgi:hypothetical protein
LREKFNYRHCEAHRVGFCAGMGCGNLIYEKQHLFIHKADCHVALNTSQCFAPRKDVLRLQFLKIQTNKFFVFLRVVASLRENILPQRATEFIENRRESLRVVAPLREKFKRTQNSNSRSVSA